MFSSGTKGVPLRLKPHSKCSIYGTAEAMPLSKTRFFGNGSGWFFTRPHSAMCPSSRLFVQVESPPLDVSEH
jgi:hypothetical protein